MKKFLKNRTALGLGSIFLALILCFGVTPLMGKAMKEQVEIVRAIKDIKNGEEITSDKITRVKVGGYNLPKDVIKDQNHILGKYAVADIYKDDYFLNSKVSSDLDGDDSYLYVSGKEESMAISITIKSLASGLSGKLKEGDIVSIISSTQNDSMPIIISELQYVEVLSVTTKEGKDIESRKEELPSTVTLSVTTTQAEKLVDQEQNGDIHIALVHRGDRKKAKEYLEIQKEYILSLESTGIEGEEERNGETEEISSTEIEETQQIKETTGE